MAPLIPTPPLPPEELACALSVAAAMGSIVDLPNHIGINRELDEIMLRRAAPPSAPLDVASDETFARWLETPTDDLRTLGEFAAHGGLPFRRHARGSEWSIDDRDFHPWRSTLPPYCSHGLVCDLYRIVRGWFK